MADKLRSYFEQLDPEAWGSKSKEDQEKILNGFRNNPEAFEKFLFEMAPDYAYAMDTQNPGTIRAIAAQVVSEGAGEASLKAVANAPVSMAKGIAGWGVPLGISGPYRALSEMEAYNAPQVSGDAATIAGGVQSAAQNLGTLGAAAVAAPAIFSNPVTAGAAIPAITAGVLGLTSGGEAAAEHMKPTGGEYGFDPSQPLAPGVTTGIDIARPDTPHSSAAALAKGVGYFAAETVFEYIPLRGMFAPVRTPGLMGSLLRAGQVALAEVPTEEATTVSQHILDRAFGTGSDQPLGGRMWDTLKGTVISAPIVGEGSSIISNVSNQAMLNRVEEQLRTSINQDVAERENLVKDALAEGAAEYLDEANPDLGVMAAPLGVKVAEGQTETLNSSTMEAPIDPTDPVDLSSLESTYNPGDTVFVKARLQNKNLPVSETIGDRKGQAVMGTIEQVNEDGTLQVKMEDGKSVPIKPEQLMSESAMGIRGVSTIVDPEAPDVNQVYRVSRKLFKEFGDSPIFKAAVGKGKYAFLTYDKLTGRPVKIGYDWALNRYPGQAQKNMVHELGHFIDLISNNSAIESMGLQRPAVGSFLGKLAREYTSARSWILKEPVINNPAYQGMLDKQQQFYDQLKVSYEQQGKTMDRSAHEAIQKNWEQLMANEGLSGLSQTEQSKIREQANKDVTAEIKQLKIPRAERNAYRKSRIANATRLRTIEAYNEKGMFYLAALQTELEAVSAAVRGLPKSLIRERHGRNATAEMYADFFTAKVLGLKTKIDGQYTDMVQALAPNLSQAFDSYMEANPVAKQVMGELLEPDTDADRQLLDIIESIKEANTKHAEQVNEQNRDPMERVSAGLWDKFKWWAYGAMGAFINENIPAMKAIDQKQVIKLQNELEKLNGLSSVMEQFILDASEIFNPIYNRIQEQFPDMPMEAVDAVAMLNRQMQGGREKNLTYKYKTGELDEEGKPIYETLTVPIDLFTGQNPVEKEDATRIVAESKLLQPHIEALSEAFDAFNDVWENQVIDRMQANGLIDSELAETLKSRRGYVTYAAFKSLEQSPSFKNVAPTLKTQTGAGTNYRSPIGATMEHGLALMFVSQLNEAKRTLVNNLPAELKTQVKAKHKVFPEPISKHMSLVVFRDNGIDVGYHVPSFLVQGIDVGRKAITANLTATVSKVMPYFRKLLTTWQPQFLPRNAIRDFTRLYINTTNPETGMPAPGIILQWGSALVDSLWLNSPEAKAAFEEETRALRGGSMILSEADFSERDATFQNSKEHLERVFTGKARDWNKPEEVKKRGLAKLFTDVVQNPIFRVITGAMGINPRALMQANKTMEAVSKRAAYRYYKPFLDKGTITRDEFEILVRHSGSPYFLNKGSWHPFLGTVSIFFNPMMQSIYEDLTAMRDRPTVAFNRFLVLSMNYALTDAMVGFLVGYSGAGGEELRKLYKLIPWQSRKNNTCIPLMITPSGKAVFIEIPLDETTAAFKRMAWTVLESRHNKFWDIAKAIASPSELGSVSLNPMLKTILDTTTLMNGGNPYDNYRQRELFNQTDFDAKGWDLGKEVLKYYYNTLSPTTPIYKSTYQDLGSESPIPPKDEIQWVAKQLETGMGLPMAQSMIKAGMIKISDQGLHDEEKYMLREDKEYSAWQSNRTKELASAIQQGNIEKAREIVELIRTYERITPGQEIMFMNWPNAAREAMRRAGWEYLDPTVARALNLSKSERATMQQKGGL